MSDTTDLRTASAIAKDLEVSDAKVKKIIKDLGVEPAAKKGCCSYFSASSVDRIKAALTK